jgi:hypothetical protein
MRHAPLLVCAAAAVAITACSPGIKVRSTVAPDANFSALSTFSVLTPPVRRADAPKLPASDPMLVNSITNQQLRQDLSQAFESRGYTATTKDSATFLVAYYAGTKQKFDTTYWGPTWDPAWRYSYRGGFRRWAWPWYGGASPAYAQVNEYTQGQVIVDVTDPKTHELLWRGQGVAQVSDDPAQYSAELQHAVTAIIKKFPQSTTAPVASTSK